MTPPVIPPRDLLSTLLMRLPDLTGLLITIVILFIIYQAQEQRITELTKDYFQLSMQCAAE